jgi:hypothetical protein
MTLREEAGAMRCVAFAGIILAAVVAQAGL